MLRSLNSGVSGLQQFQGQMDVIGNNISNVNTEGYSRQKAQFETYPAMNFGDFFIGQGVKITNVSREHEVRTVLSNSYGFGGNNASVVIRAAEG